MRIHALHISAGGVPKLPVDEAACGPLGLAGDKQKHTKIHGGPLRALCLYSLEVIEALQAEGHPIRPGAAGENVTLAGVDWAGLRIGDAFAFGSVHVELTGPTQPCKQIAACFADRRFKRIDHDLHPGWSRWYARVIFGGVLRPGMGTVLSPSSLGA